MKHLDTVLGRDTEFGFLDAAAKSHQVLNPQLIANDDEEKMLHALREELSQATHFVFSVAFISSSGIALLKQAIVQFEGTGEIITSNYLDFNDPAVFRELLLLENIDVFIHDDVDRGFHAKGYIFHRDEGVTAIIGSSNLTANALLINQEWNLRFSAFPEGDIALQLNDAVKRQKRRSQPLTEEWISHYEANRSTRPVLIPGGDSITDLSLDGRIYPNSMQIRALESLRELQEQGEHKALIIAATGTGKTILSALAARAAEPVRLLFIAHREQILNKAMSEFQRVLEEDENQFGKLIGSLKQTDRKYVFASIQSLERDSTLSEISPDEFDYIIIDEVHRSGSPSYRKVIDYFTPSFLLGMTATPERTDGFNIFELFDYNVSLEIRLHEALEEKLLVPFHYYGVKDFIDQDNQTVGDASQLANLVTEERVKYVLQMLRIYGHPTDVKGLMFCSRTSEAHELSRLFNSSSVNGRKLRTKVLTGNDSTELRDEVVQELEDGVIDYILTVDIFNEGIDIPPVNQVVMLRGTQSSIIFTQQLGRGLRKAPGKDHLRVIDFIGNYANNYLVPVALFGDQSRNKDSIRKNLLENNSTNTIAGVSSVNFDEIAQQRILSSLSQATIISKPIFKKDIQQLINRLGQIPQLFDFARFDTVDPVLLASAYDKSSKPRSYWQLLKDLKFIEHGPTIEEAAILAFLSGELLSGKRPHELLLLRELIQKKRVTRSEFADLLESQGVHSSSLTFNSVERILSLAFYTSDQVKKFGGSPLVQADEYGYHLSTEFQSLYDSEMRNDHGPAESFRDHVDDVIKTALFLSHERGYWSGELKEGSMYSRREVCWLLNWENNHEGTLYGYKRDKVTSTVPIFVNYYKDDDSPESIKYENNFISPQKLLWYSKNNRTIESPELQPIINNEYVLHLFVTKQKPKKGEVNYYYYLGQVLPVNPEQKTMPITDEKPLNVVTMGLEIQSPVEKSLYEYLTRTTVS